jgi:hypothetical protein
MVSLGALVLAPVGAARAAGAVPSAFLPPGLAPHPASFQRLATTDTSPLRAPAVVAARAGGREGDLYLGGAADRYVQFFSLRLNRRATRATQRATLVVGCKGDPSIRTVLDNLTLAQITVAEGRARGSGAIDEAIAPSVPTVGGLSRRGIVNYRVRVGSRGRAAGILRSRFTLTDPASGATRARCDTGTVRWSARIAPPSAGRGNPAPVGRSGYFGSTAQRLPFLLEVLPGGRVVRPAGMTFRAPCPSLRARPLDLVSTARMPISRGKPRKRGRFGSSGRLTRRFASEEFGPVTESYSWRLRGRFGAEGVAGTWRVTGTVIRQSDGARVATCTTGRNRWRAVR